MAHRDLWTDVLRRLCPTIKKAHFITWFQGTAVIEKQGELLTIGVPTAFALNWLSSKYQSKILEAAQEVDSELKKIEFQVHTRLAEKSDTEGIDVKRVFAPEADKKVRKVRNLNEVTVIRGQSGERIVSKILNARYKLKNFVVGKDNQLPHAAARAVANMPGGIYNPLYIYGSVGLGKTHLVQAIGNEILRNFPDMIVKYMTAEKFVSEVVEAIGRRQMSKFKDQYRKVDAFLMDDVQFFARKDSSQQEFFHTFDELYGMNRQIVITSDRSPSQLDDLDERLKSRFGMGMVVELLFPDYETRMAILQEKCQEYQVIIDPEVLSFIATNVHTSVRELEGVLKQVVAESQLENRVTTIRAAAEIIRRLNKAQEIIGFEIERKQHERIIHLAEEVIDLVAVHYKLTVGELIGKERRKEVMHPRQVCMYLIKNELGQSYERIGEEFGGRNHTTVMHACNKIAKKLQKDLRLVKEVNTLKMEMGL